jgi:RND family efflux transporter MFP subunit
MTDMRSHTRIPNRNQLIVLAVTVLMLLAFAAIGLASRPRVASTVQSEPERNREGPSVTVANVVPVSSELQLNLPGALRAWQDTPLYARAEGYLVRLHADLGDEVKAGQLLAEIDTPDLDQDLTAARAEAAQAEAQLGLAKSSYARIRPLAEQRAASQLEADERATAAQARQADLDLAQARVHRLEQLSRYKRVTAPFAGRITRRQAEPGVLVGSSTQLFQLAAIERLRVQVQVPQSNMRSVVPGLTAKINVREFPGETFEGRVTRTSGSLDSARTMTAEIELDNSSGRLMPGLYAQVGFMARNTTNAMLIPTNALIVNQRGTQVALVEPSGTVRMLPVRAGRDLGPQVEIVEGLSIGARVVTNPPDTLQDGVVVRVATPMTAQSKAPSAARADKKG